MLCSYHPKVQDAKKRIYTYDQAGDYDKALNLARKIQKKLLQNSFDQDSISLTILQLEEKLLHLGYSNILI